MIIPFLVGGIDQRDTGRQKAQRQQRRVGVLISAYDAALIRILVVIVEIIHREAVAAVVGVYVHTVLDRRGRYSALGHQRLTVQHIVIAGVKGVFCQPLRRGGLRQHHDIAVDGFELVDSRVPEVRGHADRVVTAEAVDPDILDPVLHTADHLGAHLIVLVIQLSGIRPVIRRLDRAVVLVLVPVRVILDPRAVPTRVIGDPVKNDLKAHLMRLIDKVLKVLGRTEFGVDALIVARGIIGPQRTLALRLADRVDRHEPQGIDPHILQAVEVRFKRLERALLGILPDVDLIQHTGVEPRRDRLFQYGVFAVDIGHHAVDNAALGHVLRYLITAFLRIGIALFGR